MTATPSAPLTVADLDDYGVNHYEDEHGECYWCCDEWPCFTHRLLSMAREVAAARHAQQQAEAVVTAAREWADADAIHAQLVLQRADGLVVEEEVMQKVRVNLAMAKAVLAEALAAERDASSADARGEWGMSGRDWSKGFTYKGIIEVKPRDGGNEIVYDVAGYGRSDDVTDSKDAAKYVLGELVDCWARIRADDDEPLENTDEH